MEYDGYNTEYETEPPIEKNVIFYNGSPNKAIKPPLCKKHRFKINKTIKPTKSEKRRIRKLFINEKIKIRNSNEILMIQTIMKSMMNMIQTMRIQIFEIDHNPPNSNDIHIKSDEDISISFSNDNKRRKQRWKTKNRKKEI